MTKDEILQKLAHKRWEIRQKNDEPGTPKCDWIFAEIVFDFLSDSEAHRTDEWYRTLEDYKPYVEIYEESFWID